MDILKQRLNQLWLRQTAPAIPVFPVQGQFPNSMGVTFREPKTISGTMLSPGRYVFRLLDAGSGHSQDSAAEPNRVRFFNDDRSRPIAELTPVADN